MLELGTELLGNQYCSDKYRIAASNKLGVGKGSGNLAGAIFPEKLGGEYLIASGHHKQSLPKGHNSQEKHKVWFVAYRVLQNGLLSDLKFIKI